MGDSIHLEIQLNDLLVLFFRFLSLPLNFFLQDGTDIALCILGCPQSFLYGSDAMFHPLIDAFQVGDLVLDYLCTINTLLLLAFGANHYYY